MKAIMMSIRPEWVAKILNKEKTIEIRKKFPIDYVGWVYIYCTKGKTTTVNLETLLFGNPKNAIRNGKVVARFWCDKVGNIEYKGFGGFAIGMPSHIYNAFVDKFYSLGDLLRASRLSYDELHGYLRGNNGYAIHITKLEIFDKPKEISEFKRCLLGHNNCVPHNCRKCPATKPLTRVPQSYCFIEI